MLKILLIEDDDNKKKDIIDYLNDTYPDKVDIEIAMSFN